MAVPCPACSHIHFETNRAALPSHCTACGHNLSEPVVPLAPASPPGARAKSVLGVRGPFFFAGLAVLSLAGWFLLSGMVERGTYLPVTATVTGGYLEWASPVNSSYVVDGQKYRTAVDRRWRLGDQFVVWHLPESPEHATEARPFAKLVAAVFLMAVGVFLLGLAFGIFGGLIEATVESIKVAIPKEPEPPAVPPRWFAVDNERRRGG